MDVRDLTSLKPGFVCSGHACLDMIPGMISNQLPSPGTLVKTGPATIVPGGRVSNSGLALHRLGVGTRLVAQVGHDLFVWERVGSAL